MISAAATVVNETRFVVVGSQAVLGTYPDAPDALLRSLEADIYPLACPEKADEIDGALGDGSPFHRSFGYYAHGVGPETAKPPAGWEERLIAVHVRDRPASPSGVVALCLEVHDLILSKCAAGRDRDWEFASDALDAGLVDLETLLARVEKLSMSQSQHERVTQMLRGIAKQAQG